MIFSFIVPGMAVGKQRGRTFIPRRKDGSLVMRGKQPLTVTMTPKKTQTYESMVKMCAYQAGVKPVCQCKMRIEIFIPVRVKQFKTKADAIEEPRVRPDVDNVVKIISDALNGVAYKDDKDVLEIAASYRFIRGGPETRVTIEEVCWQDYIEDGNNYGR